MANPTHGQDYLDYEVSKKLKKKKEKLRDRSKREKDD